MDILIKSIYSESATKFEKITHLDLTFAKFCGTLRKPLLPSWKYSIVTLNFMSVLHTYFLKKIELFTICTADQPCELLIMCRMDCLLSWDSHLVITSNITSVSGSISSWFKLNLWKSYMPIKYNKQLCRYLVLSHLWSSNRLD